MRRMLQLSDDSRKEPAISIPYAEDAPSPLYYIHYLSTLQPSVIANDLAPK